MIWKEQTGEINMDSVGATYGTGGVNAAYFKSKGRQLTRLAREAAPPRQRNTGTDLLGGLFLGFFLGGIAGLVALLCGFKFLASILFWFLQVIGIIYGLFLVENDENWNKTVWPKVYAVWQHTWICNRCGKRFTVHYWSVQVWRFFCFAAWIWYNTEKGVVRQRSAPNVFRLD